MTRREKPISWMVWFWLALLLLVCGELCQAQTSNVQTVKAWTRSPILGIPGGGLLDPSGTLADGQRLAAVQAINSNAYILVSAGNAGLSNALSRLYAVANRTNDFTGRLYVAADLDADPDYENLEAYRVQETVDPDGTLHYYVHFTRELTVPPKTVWSFKIAPGVVYWSPGSVSTNNITTNVLGYACYNISVPRPPQIGNVVLMCHKFLKFGTTETPLDIPDSGLRITSDGTTRIPFTGSLVRTNLLAVPPCVVTKVYLSGFLNRVTTNQIEEVP